MWTDRRTDMTNLMVDFRNFAIVTLITRNIVESGEETANET